ncbi:MAG: hypothetical protein B6226_01205 [Candidatus Cloacimonetes bacterium 4572_65]|nr:MAG: hypothetical protein B6226_01205 [Candidatus Cloacimonetes bacterium 4572_65]
MYKLSLIIVTLNAFFHSIWYWIGSLLFIIIVPVLAKQSDTNIKRLTLLLLAILLMYPFKRLYIFELPIAFLGLLGFSILITLLFTEVFKPK